MIKLTRIQGEDIYVNEDNIQWIECKPDTTITFINGSRFIVKEGIEEILSLIKKTIQPETHQVTEEDEKFSTNDHIFS